MASMYKKDANQIGLHHRHRHHSMPHHATEPIHQTPHDSKGMTNKHVHWSQYADEISYFTIQDVVRLADSSDDDYFSDENVEVEEPLKEKRKHEKEIFIHPDFWKAVDNATSQSQPPLSPPPQSPPPLDLSGKTRFLPVSETDSTISDDSNFFDDPKYVEKKRSLFLRKSQSPAPKTPKHEKHLDLKTEKEKKKRKKEEVEMGDADKEASSNGKAQPKNEEKPPVVPKSPEGMVERPNGAKKMQNSYWISPQIYLFKRNATSARGDYARGVKSPVESGKMAKRSEISSSTGRRRVRHFSDYLYEPQSRSTSRTRGVGVAVVKPPLATFQSNHNAVESTLHRKHSKSRFDYITENMKPNLPKVPPKPKRSTKTFRKAFVKGVQKITPFTSLVLMLADEMAWLPSPLLALYHHCHHHGQHDQCCDDCCQCYYH
ncbi:hypothetical protein EGR_04453 [Echinococcus granulosus]|uniref:Uncharacterized protein n=1 Tax=Echinococcus granulosus TaxID=6210 RepID=W6UGI4_ECHGR|nr:hypothetical protein EGR_04453 [Echinococcus granulosus]EUB60620.1 hypothetical protein EGR_04453 [Echinococcus granulosus]